MWIFTTVAFFSVVQKKPEDSFLTVRVRVASDLDSLRAQFMPQLSATIKGGGTDYPFRATISHRDFAAGLSKMGGAIHYNNFKTEVGRRMGRRREQAYHKVWHDLYGLGSEEGH